MKGRLVPTFDFGPRLDEPNNDCRREHNWRNDICPCGTTRKKVQSAQGSRNAY
jgi:hypothetical protein